MSGPYRPADEKLGEELFRAYRRSIGDPPYGTTDRALLRAAADQRIGHRPAPAVYASLTLLVAVLGLMLSVTILHRPSGQRLPAMYGDTHPSEPQTSYDVASINTALGAAYAREHQLEQATLALQFTAESQSATLALQAETTEPELYDATMELTDRALRIRPISSAVR